jgi:hypothetical protein
MAVPQDSSDIHSREVDPVSSTVYDYAPPVRKRSDTMFKARATGEISDLVNDA